MFEQLFTHDAVIRKHRDGPFADARQGHLRDLATAGYGRGTLLRHAAYALCVAKALERWPRMSTQSPIEPAELERLATDWASHRVSLRARAARLPRRSFLQLARAILSRLGRLADAPVDQLEARVAEFVEANRERWPSAYTRRSVAFQTLQFLRFVEGRGTASELITFADIDAYLHHRRGYARGSNKLATGALRSWLDYAPSRGWAPPGLAAGVWQPRIYSLAGLLPGPTPEQVRATVKSLRGSQSVVLRDRALFLLLSTYGLRASEVCRLRLQDLDWVGSRLRIERSKAGRSGWLPLETTVGDAIARYLQKARPRDVPGAVFLSIRAPFRPISTSALYNVVAHHLRAAVTVPRGRGPHGLRHASARALLGAGASLKTIADHLGHRGGDSAEIYAKVDTTSLRQVAWTNVEGLS